MKCPFCQADQDKVTDSRASDDGLAIRRRRQCLSCERRFTTYERYEPTMIKVVKKNGEREPFRREKILRGLEKACWKRPVTSEQIESVVAAVESDVYEHFEMEVPSRYIGERIFEALREVDDVAFVRFASVYREFQDVNDFVEELEPMLRPAHQNK